MPAPAGVQPGASQPRKPGSDVTSPAEAAPETPPAASPESSLQPTPAEPTSSGPGQAEAPKRSTGRRILRVLKVIAIVIALPVLALLIGLLIAWIVHVIRGGDEARTGTSGGSTAVPSLTPSSTAPSAAASSGTPSAPASGPASITVPSDWVAESEPPAGVTFSHPNGWIRRTSGTAIFRFAPVSATSTAPGIEGVGVQVAAAGVTPDAAIRQFVGSNYGSQPGYTAAAPTAVPANTPGKHDDEVRSIVRYTRSGVAVVVVVDAYTISTPGGNRTVVVLGRSANANPTRAAQLEAITSASLKAR
jgi:hypothetical protein